MPALCLSFLLANSGLLVPSTKNQPQDEREMQVTPWPRRGAADVSHPPHVSIHQWRRSPENGSSWTPESKDPPAYQYHHRVVHRKSISVAFTLVQGCTLCVLCTCTYSCVGRCGVQKLVSDVFSVFSALAFEIGSLIESGGH